MTITTFYPADARALEDLTPRNRENFEGWMAELELEHERLGRPYGAGPLAKTTGLTGWLEFFNDAWDAGAALEEDLSNA